MKNISKCIKGKGVLCEIHKNGKYLHWPCGDAYNPKERHSRYIKERKEYKCTSCENFVYATDTMCIKCIAKIRAQKMLGKRLPPKWRASVIKACKERIGEKHPSWVGDKIGYSGVHHWIRDKYGNPRECENCGIKGKYNKRNWSIQWANISKKYLRDRNDYKALCPKCHAKYDKRNKSIESYKCGNYRKYDKGCRCELCKKAKSIYRKTVPSG